ncbi:MAG: hypothetical protein AAGK04_01650 [Planctomycetota bacterium]
MPSDEATRDRVEKLEEALLFSERTIEQLSEEVRVLGDRLVAAERAIRRNQELATGLSGRLVELESRDGPDAEGKKSDEELKADRPPHSSGRAQGY